MTPDEQTAREIAAEIVRLYLPEESVDVGRGRRCAERIETRITTARTRARKEGMERAAEIAEAQAGGHYMARCCAAAIRAEKQ